jgi:hypothetical protein
MLRKDAVTPVEALSYAMSLPVTVTISGIDSLEVLHQNLGVARGFITVKYEGKVGREQHGYPSPDELPL